MTRYWSFNMPVDDARPLLFMAEDYAEVERATAVACANFVAALGETVEAIEDAREKARDE